MLHHFASPSELPGRALLAVRQDASKLREEAQPTSGGTNAGANKFVTSAAKRSVAFFVPQIYSASGTHSHISWRVRQRPAILVPYSSRVVAVGPLNAAALKRLARTLQVNIHTYSGSRFHGYI